jgi:L-alanine-DL-glutamate epimerase-like enolase superfamily enzyme
VRILKINARTIDISRYADASIPSGGLTTTVVAIVTSAERGGRPVAGYGFSSIGRFGQTGLIAERFAPRLLAATDHDLIAADGALDPLRAWDVLMKDEKAGGHGERCVAVGTLDMALWDAAAKIADVPLHALLQQRFARAPMNRVAVYAAGGYDFPVNGVERLRDEIREFLDTGYTTVKIKIGRRPLNEDLTRIEAALSMVSGTHLAVDAMNRYSPRAALEVADAIAPYGLCWFEDPSDPLDFDAHARLCASYEPALGIGEATFSLPDARNLIRYAGMRAGRDRLIFDPAHCYGLPEYIRIIEAFESAGWSRRAFFPHGGHLFSLHVAAGLGLGGSESNPKVFQPFGGFEDDALVESGFASLPSRPGVGFEGRAALKPLLMDLAAQ